MPGIITQLPYWNPDSDKVLEPADAKQDTGWLAGEAVPYNWLNWFFKYTYEGVKTLNDNAFLNTAGINEVMEDTLANRPDAANQQELDMFIAQDTKEIYQVIGGSWARVAGSIAEQIGYSGSLDSSDVKAALDELDTEKLAKSSGYSSIDTVANIIAYINNNADVPNADYADNSDKLDGNQYSDIQNWVQSWVNGNADVPNADYADNAGNADSVDGLHAGDIWSNQDESHNFSGKGYVELPNGLIINWGTTSITDYRVDVYFSKSFPNALLTAVGTPASDNGQVCNIPHSYNDHMELRMFSDNSGVTGGNSIRWIAIGY